MSTKDMSGVCVLKRSIAWLEVPALEWLRGSCSTGRRCHREKRGTQSELKSDTQRHRKPAPTEVSSEAVAVTEFSCRPPRTDSHNCVFLNRLRAARVQRSHDVDAGGEPHHC